MHLYLTCPVEGWVLCRRQPVLKSYSCYCNVSSRPFQRSPFWVFLRIGLFWLYAMDRNCHSIVTSTGECEWMWHAVVLRWCESGGVAGNCVSVSGLRDWKQTCPAGQSCSERCCLQNPHPTPSPGPSRESVRATDDGIWHDMYTWRSAEADSSCAKHFLRALLKLHSAKSFSRIFIFF